MKKFNSFLLALTFIVSACTSTPQVTITPEPTATLPPPTETPIPTPTLHPKFAELQEQIAASGGRFTLNPDGTIFDGAEPLPGVTIALDGTMTLTVDGETVTLDPKLVVFDDENGFSYPGYEQNADGGWVEAAPSAEQVWEKEVKEWGLDPEKFTPKYSADGTMVIYDNETNKPVYAVGTGVKTATGEEVKLSGHWKLEYAKEMIANSGKCYKNPYVGASPYLAPSDADERESWWNTIALPLGNAARDEMKKHEYSGNTLFDLYLGGDNNCWAVMPVKSAKGGTKETPKTNLFTFDINKKLVVVPVYDGDYIEMPAIE
ncbi:MAG TPA: hypothetical protein PK078_02740 [Anaerolineales bacterium]|nr:hypothetical protein [Anaerolineales bacterium]